MVARLNLWTVMIADLISYDSKFNRDDCSIAQTSRNYRTLNDAVP